MYNLKPIYTKEMDTFNGNAIVSEFPDDPIVALYSFGVLTAILNTETSVLKFYNGNEYSYHTLIHITEFLQQYKYHSGTSETLVLKLS